MQEEIIDFINKNYNFGEIINISNPNQGMSGKVFILKFSAHQDLVVKYGGSVDKDVYFIHLIGKNNSLVPVPKIFGSFSLNNVHVVLMERVKGVLFGEVPTVELPKYLPSVIANLNELHKIFSCNNWNEYLHNILNGKTIDWEDVLSRKILDQILLRDCKMKIEEKLKSISFESNSACLLHTDFNQNNVFVNRGEFKILGVIDWEEAVFGDPVYDFARFHLHLWHRGCDEKIIGEYFKLLNFSLKELEREDIYFDLFIFHYLAYYSEVENEFTWERIKLHQKYLKEKYQK